MTVVSKDKMLILLQQIPFDITEEDLADIIDHIDIVNNISIVRNHDNPTLSFAWIEITCEQCTQAGLNAICDVLNHRHFKNHPMKAYPVLFSHH